MLLLCAVGTNIVACVTEPGTVSSRGVPLRRLQPSPRASNLAGSGTSKLPDGPVASPAAEALSVTTSVRVAVTPIGVVPFDGQTLPLVSPDGRYLATQIGEAPTWPTMLARPGAVAPLRTRIEIYDITRSPPARVAPAEPLPPGLLLSHASESGGFLVESPRPDGARWIGRISWRGEQIQWIVRGDEVATNPVAVPGQGSRSGYIYSVRPSVAAAQSADSDAKLRDAFSLATTISGGMLPAPDASRSMLFPVVVPTGGAMLCFSGASDGLELVLFEEQMAGEPSMKQRWRRILHPSADPILAYQAVTPTQGFPVADAAEYPPGYLFYHPAADRVVFYDFDADRLVALAPGSISACWMRDAAGPAVLLTTPKGLVVQRLVDSPRGHDAAAPIRLLAQPWAPRATTSDDRPFILIGPGPDAEPRLLAVSVMSILPPESSMAPER